MRGRFGWRRAPPWWPENEPWPPQGEGDHWRTGRARFFRRAALGATVFFAISAAGSLVLGWHAAVAFGIVAPTSPRAVFGGVVPIALALVVTAALINAVRHAAIRMDAVMNAADRVAAGNYAVRVPERGPAAVRGLARSFNTMTKRLERHDRLRRDLMADVAHELRTPLTVIQGKLEGLLDGVYPRDDGQLHQLLEETRVLSRLVEDLRTLALSESGALALQREPADLAALAHDVAAAFTGDATARGVALHVAAPAATTLEVDPVRIREVLSNLVANALRHTPAGGTVTVRLTTLPGGDASIEVQDTGSGMSPEDLAHAFDRFYKGSRSRGSGLGLTIAKNLVTAHGGDIRATSEPDRGTTIAFTMPRHA